MGALLPKQLVDSGGAPTLEGLKLKVAEAFTRLLDKLDDNGAQVAQVGGRVWAGEGAAWLCGRDSAAGG
jgi:hypothetical protein